ncbi:murein DD-endopeptidase MepM/ murein hydrolase activator NlpD [Roseivirga pacifica]|uniref:Murein DD-endopeptidase MepM and murein hydrolase activator NlpD, contain LysM domain n=1 Tax=Roseivirga pacifica TaxID=1267423 RepID=A0A1I0QP66_9BACT|nr:M23 family metallopeptidase [Roseivirga pacifica]MCO6360994.1 peptidoglycan DD-metalloendopeptidase family protein [Roseivirga pacifica]MCO6368883.1 peptidoglycan DD-metalloendopeptidase family protein [Roseivirga pacifica]MCO6373026.1 peptidoglycan DD-metalloendopeptidase family protein [Roseivirga pacifica]MCO6373106.1 peptidoglycan DD-metalloendopeptidase family protein [Roseivirga pacifica]MCO6377637.1 peptidoglycan DD-metalloendopeptidase family protein [Roseivirga pacifica]
MSKIKYYYDTETCKYERVKVKKRDIVINALGFMSLSLVLAVGIILVLSKYFDSPKETALRQENEDLKGYYDLMQSQLENMDQMLKVLQEKDDNVYRAIFEAEPIPETVREAGSGGALKYKNLLESDLSNKDLVLNNLTSIDKLKKRIYIQTKSYDEILELAENKDEFYAAMPAIQPVANEELRRLASGYGMRTDPILKVKKMHYGTDFSAEQGTPIYATADGTITYTRKSQTGYGWHIKINHGYGFETLYGHMSKFAVRSGQKVKRGQIIGYVGNSGKSTAPHLHYEVHVNGIAKNPVYYFYQDLDANEFDEILRLSSIENQSLGSYSNR